MTGPIPVLSSLPSSAALPGVPRAAPGGEPVDREGLDRFVRRPSGLAPTGTLWAATRKH